MSNGSMPEVGWMNGFGLLIGHQWVLWLILLVLIAIFTVGLVRDWRKG